MNRSTLRWAIIVLTLVTAVVHLALGIGSLVEGNLFPFGVLFPLNFVGYIVLMGGVVTELVPILSQNKQLAHYALLVYTALTFVLYFVFNGFTFGAAAIVSKVAELLLIVATFMHMNATQ